MSVLAAGVDEAGYGPLLGPLVVSICVVEADCGTPSCNSSVIGDSKKVFSGKNRMARLESAVLGILKSSGYEVRTFAELLDLVGEDDGVGDRPWVSPPEVDLPLCASMASIDEAAAAFERETAGVMELKCVRSRVVTPRDYNDMVNRLGNKLHVLFSVVSELLERSGFPDVVCVDRLSSTRCYAPLISRFVGAAVWVEEESAAASWYRLFLGEGGSVRLGFVRKADTFVSPVCLASMFSKYIREVEMSCFNRFWSARVPGLAPTQGYYVDGRRFLDEIRPAMRESGIPSEWVVRSR